MATKLRSNDENLQDDNYATDGDDDGDDDVNVDLIMPTTTKIAITMTTMKFSISLFNITDKMKI